MTLVPSRIDRPLSWYVESFGPEYLEIYSHRDAAEGEAEADRIVALLELPRGARVLDLACGAGRHALPLLRRGLRPIGVDLSQALLLEARRQLPGDNALFVRGDMRALPFGAGFDAVVSLFTSFGYFAREGDDRRTVHEIARLLRPGGVFLLDFLNAERVRATLVPHSEEQRAGRRILLDRRLSDDGSRIEKRIRVYPRGASDPERVFHESVRLYDRDDLVALVRHAGLRVTRLLGSFRGEAHDSGSPRTILLSRKA